MTRNHIDAILLGMCVAFAGAAVWLSATGCEWVALGLFSILLSAGIIILGCILFGYRRFTVRPVFAVMIGPALSLAITVSVAATQWPLRVTYNVSRSAFDSYAQRVRASEPLTVPQRLGIFTIRKAEVYPNGIVCLWTAPRSGGNTGFVQCGPGHVPFNIWSIVRLDDRWQFISED